jgi:hypothetical protein
VWKIDNLEIRGKYGKDKVLPLYADSEVICSNVNAIFWEVEEPSGIQWEICKECGETYCAPGNYASIRKVPYYENHALDQDNKGILTHPPLYLIMPSFSAILADAETAEPEEHYPPDYLCTKGVLCITEEQVCKVARNLRKTAPHLTCAEAARILQWEAPAKCLGHFPDEIALQADRIVSCSENNMQQQLHSLSTSLNDLETTKDNCSYRPLHSTDEIISFNIKANPVIEWRCLVRSEGKVRSLLVEPGIVLEWG